MSDPRNNAEDAYQAFKAMPDSEWQGLITSLTAGGTLQPAEQKGFDRAFKERGLTKAGMPSYMKPKKLKEGEADPESEDGKTFEVKGRELMALKASKEDYKEKLAEVNKQIDALEEELAQIMLAKGVDLFRVNGLATFFTSAKTYANVTDKEAFVAWLDAEGMGAMAKRSVHPSTLNAWVKDWIGEGKQLPDSVNSFTKTEVNTRKA